MYVLIGNGFCLLQIPALASCAHFNKLQRLCCACRNSYAFNLWFCFFCWTKHLNCILWKKIEWNELWILKIASVLNLLHVRVYKIISAWFTLLNPPKPLNLKCKHSSSYHIWFVWSLAWAAGVYQWSCMVLINFLSATKLSNFRVLM